MLTLRSLANVTHHVRLDIGGEYFAFGNALCDPYTEISGARANVGDTRGAFQMQSIQNLFGLLPSIAFRVVELFGPLIRIFEFYDGRPRQMDYPYRGPDGRPYPRVARWKPSARKSRA